MSAAPAYGEDKGGSAGPGEPEYGHDPASGGIFSSDYKRQQVLRVLENIIFLLRFPSENLLRKDAS